MRTKVMGGVLLLVIPLGCPTPSGPSREKSADYFGLQAGPTLTYEVTDSAGGPATTARVTLSKDNSFAGFLSYRTEERSAANTLQEVLVYDSEVEDLRLHRAGDCLPDCTEFSNPPTLVKNPVVENQAFESETATRIQDIGGNVHDGARERHAITVGVSSNVVTPAGTFKAFPITWRRFVVGSNAASVDRTLYFAEHRGFIALDKGTAHYKVQSGVSP